MYSYAFLPHSVSVEEMKTIVEISTLKKLLQINNSRINVYKVAYKDTRYTDLKTNFIKYIATSNKYKSQLIQIVEDLGGSSIIYKSIKGSLFINIMKLNMVTTNYDRRTILNYCTYWEQIVSKGYQYALNKKIIGSLSIPIQSIMREQHKQITLEQADMSLLRDMSV